jgi:predicted double-glycine peptidase
MESLSLFPICLFLAGIAWRAATCRRQRMTGVAAAGIAVLWFCHVASWLIQPVPLEELSHKVTGQAVRQSRPWSCVPASCATALGEMDIPASEAGMAQLTRAGPGHGSTLLRAYAGLELKLRHTPIRPQIIRPTWEQLRNLPMPALALLDLEPGRTHMVTITAVDPWQVHMLDPAAGPLSFPRLGYEQYVRRPIIVFVGPRGPRRHAADMVSISSVSHLDG